MANKQYDSSAITKASAHEHPWKMNCKCKVFVEVDARLEDVGDEFFNANELWALKFKSKTWTKIGSIRNKIVAAKIEQLLGSGTARFSGKCGCSCGCSPGFNVTFDQSNPHERENIWMNISVTEEEAKPMTEFMKQAPHLLAAEIAANS